MYSGRNGRIQTIYCSIIIIFSIRISRSWQILLTPAFFHFFLRDFFFFILYPNVPSDFPSPRYSPCEYASRPVLFSCFSISAASFGVIVAFIRCSHLLLLLSRLLFLFFFVLHGHVICQLSVSKQAACLECQKRMHAAAGKQGGQDLYL